MHVVVFTRSSSVARALASTPICCSILQYTKRTKPSADTWAIDPWVRVVPSFLCASLFQSVCVRVGDDVFLVATWKLFVIFTTYRMPPLGAFSCRPTVSPESSAARMPLLILWLSPTRYCCRERHNSLFVLEHTSSRVGFSSNMRRKLVGLRRMILVFICIFYATRTTRYFSRVWYVHTRTLYEAKQGCGVVSCTTFSYCVLIQSNRTHMTSYVCTWGLLLLIFHGKTYFTFFSRYLVRSR